MSSKPALNPKKARLTWVTADYFIDCDYNIGIIRILLQHFDIHWILILPANRARFSENDFLKFKELPGLQIDFLYWKWRARNVKMLLFYQAVLQKIKSGKPDIIYVNDVPTSPFSLALFLRLNKNKSIVAAHDGDVKASFKMPFISKMVFKLAYDHARYVNMFSKSQASVFKNSYPDKRVFTIPLALKNFGESIARKPEDHVVFLFFGTINSNKNLELLIDAGNNLYEKGYRNFKISINGSCTNWEHYQGRIKYPEIFETDIRLLDNSEIPALLSRSHYMVFPYKEVSQSGAIKVAFQYCVPTIVSDLEGFTDEIHEGKNAFVFQSENVADLERAMTERLIHHEKDYPELRKCMAEINGQYYSDEAIAGNYINMFNQVMLTHNAQQ